MGHKTLPGILRKKSSELCIARTFPTQELPATWGKAQIYKGRSQGTQKARVSLPLSVWDDETASETILV